MATYCPEDLVPRELSCPICFEDYDIHDPTRYPKLLLCLHTFCANCTRLLWRRDGTLECSMCRMLHQGVIVDDLYDNHVIFTHLRQKIEERDLEFARRIDQEMRSQTGDQVDTNTAPLLPPAASTPVRREAPPPPAHNTAPIVAPSLPPPASTQPQTCRPAASLVINSVDLRLQGSDEEEDDDDDDVDVDELLEGVAEESFPSVIVLSSDSSGHESFRPLWEDGGSTDDEDGVDGIPHEEDEGEMDEEQSSAEEGESLVGDEEEVDREDLDAVDGPNDFECFLSMNDPFTNILQPSDSSNDSDDLDYDENGIDDEVGIGDEDDEDRWHSASEECSPNLWNPHLSDDSEDVDDGASDVIPWALEALAED